MVVDQDTRLAARDWTGHRYVGRSKRNNIEITTVPDTTEQSTRTPKCRFELGVPKRTASDDDDKHMYIPPYDPCPESGDQRWREASLAITSARQSTDCLKSQSHAEAEAARSAIENDTVKASQFREGARALRNDRQAPPPSPDRSPVCVSFCSLVYVAALTMFVETDLKTV